MQLVNEKPVALSPGITCKICGNTLYSTDWGNQQVTLHCSSAEARFWDFDRGTSAQAKSKEHWDQSREQVHVREGLSATG